MEGHLRGLLRDHPCAHAGSNGRPSGEQSLGPWSKAPKRRGWPIKGQSRGRAGHTAVHRAEHAAQLAELLRPLVTTLPGGAARVKVNLIPYNRNAQLGALG